MILVNLSFYGRLGGEGTGSLGSDFVLCLSRLNVSFAPIVMGAEEATCWFLQRSDTHDLRLLLHLTLAFSQRSNSLCRTLRDTIRR